MFKNIKFGRNKDSDESDSKDKMGKSKDKKEKSGKGEDGQPKAEDSKNKKEKQAEQGEDTVDGNSENVFERKKSNRDKLDQEKITDFQVQSVLVSVYDNNGEFIECFQRYYWTCFWQSNSWYSIGTVVPSTTNVWLMIPGSGFNCTRDRGSNVVTD